MRRIWAVATNTVKQALRMKIAAVFVILLLVLLPVMSIAMTGDGTLKGRLQTFVSYGFSLVSLLLCLLTIVVSVYSLTSDLEQRQIYTVLTKPIRRFELILGKLLGVLLLDAVLLVLFSGLIYGIVIYLPKFIESSKEELRQAQNEFYTARAGLKVPEVDVSEEVLDTYNKMKDTHQLPDEMSRDEALAWITKQKRIEKRAAAPGNELVWEFNNVRPLDPNQSLFVRFKYDVSVNPPDLHVYSSWIVGDLRQIKYGPEIATPFYTFNRKDLIRTFHEIEVPADSVASDGYLAVGFINIPQLNNTVVMFPPKDGLEVLYKANTFSSNFMRVVLIIFMRLFFLACLGILASSFLSFPVAVLLSLSIFFAASISGFCLYSFEYLSENVSSVYRYTLRPALQLLPQFDKFTPSEFLVPGRLLSWFVLGKVALSLVCLKAVLLLLIGLLIFSYREVAKIAI